VTSAPPSVVIVDDHDLFRAGVRAELEGRVAVRGEAGTVEAAEAAVIEAEPDVVLLDVHMPGGGGVEVIRRVIARRPAQRFLALSVSDAPEDVIAVEVYNGASQIPPEFQSTLLNARCGVVVIWTRVGNETDTAPPRP